MHVAEERRSRAEILFALPIAGPVVTIDQQLDRGAVDKAGDGCALGHSIEDVALLIAERFDYDDYPMCGRQGGDTLQEFNDLTRGTAVGKPLGHRPSAAGTEDNCIDTGAAGAFTGDCHIGLKRRQIDLRAGDLQAGRQKHVADRYRQWRGLDQLPRCCKGRLISLRLQECLHRPLQIVITGSGRRRCQLGRATNTKLHNTPQCVARLPSTDNPMRR